MVEQVIDQQSDDIFQEAYDRLLGSLVLPVPPSDEQVINNCRDRLTMLIRLLDTEISAHCIIPKNLISIQNDHLKNMRDLLKKISDKRFTNKETVLKNLLRAKGQLASAAEVRKTFPDGPDIEQIRKNNEDYYDYLMKSVEWFEKALPFWKSEDAPDNKKATSSGPEIVKAFRERRDIFLNEISEFFSGAYNNLEPPPVEDYEGRLRETIAWLLYKISDEQVNSVIGSKSLLIQRLREAKKWLNLVLDEFILCEQKGVDKVHMFEYLLVQCEDCFDQVERSWAEK